MSISRERTLQEALEESVETNKYTEQLGKHFLKLTDDAVRKNGLYFKFTEFEVDFIIKPRIIDDLLLKCLRYKKQAGSATVFIGSIINTSCISGIRAVRLEKQSLFKDVYYYEDMQNIVDDNDFDDSVLWDEDLRIRLEEFNQNRKKR